MEHVKGMEYVAKGTRAIPSKPNAVPYEDKAGQDFEGHYCPSCINMSVLLVLLIL